MKSRTAYWDNLKGLLILLVVCGHLFAQLPGGQGSALYKFIYLFHMPLFVFCSGYLGSFSPQKIIKKLLLPYVCFQTLYCLLSLQRIQLTTPIWILWYLPALALWRTSTPFLDGCPKRLTPVILAACMLCGCLCGFDDTVGEYATLSRVIVFYPFYTAGYYAKKYARVPADGEIPANSRRTAKTAAILLLLFTTVLSGLAAPHIDARLLHQTFSYANGHYTLFFRAAHYLAAAMIGVPLLILTPQKTTFLCAWGRQSLVIYLSHVVIVPFAWAFARQCAAGSALPYAMCVGIAAVFCALVTSVSDR